MIKIITLGDFDIIINNQSILEDVASQKRLVKLFKYFLIHNNIKLLPEDIIEDLWGNEDFKNPLNMLRAQISRLRRIVNTNKFEVEPFFTIQHVNGYYIFKLDEQFTVDFIEFEEKLERDFINIKNDIKNDYLNFKELLLSYNGKLLKELGEEDWLIPIRSRFSRLYVKGITYYIEYLKENLMYTEVINICEKAIKIKPYEEIIHFNFMEALVKLQQHSYALIHYEYFTRRLFNDFKITPSKKLNEFYKEIKARDDNSYSNIDLDLIDEKFKKQFDFERATFCDLHYFKFIYNYEKINKDKRSDTNIGLGIITLESRNHRELTKKEIKKGMELLVYVLHKSLRPGDIVSKWNERQMLMLIYGLEKECTQYIADTINDQFNLAKIYDNLGLNIKMNIL